MKDKLIWILGLWLCAGLVSCDNDNFEEPQSTLQLPAERAPAPPDLAPKAELTPSAAPQPAPEPVPQAASPPEQSHVAHAKPEAPGREDAPPPNPTVAPPPRPEVAAISPTEVAALLKRARALIGVGDIAGARRVLERAASAKEGSVLFALAETYDPAMLAQWGVVGMRPNVERARVLYQQALERGIGQAGQRLTALP